MPGGFEAGEGLPGAEEPAAALPEPGAETPETGAGGEASPLLATPGKRDEDFSNKQDGRKVNGPRTKAYRRVATPESMAGGSIRSVLPGSSELSQLSKGIYTEQLSNYEDEEERIFSINYETHTLIESLNSMEPKSDET
jgi:hypothetical protein